MVENTDSESASPGRPPTTWYDTSGSGKPRLSAFLLNDGARLFLRPVGTSSSGSDAPGHDRSREPTWISATGRRSGTPSRSTTGRWSWAGTGGTSVSAALVPSCLVSRTDCGGGTGGVAQGCTSLSLSKLSAKPASVRGAADVAERKSAALPRRLGDV